MGHKICILRAQSLFMMWGGSEKNWGWGSGILKWELGGGGGGIKCRKGGGVVGRSSA